MEFAKVGAQSLAALGAGAALAILLPTALAVIWKIRKKERFSTILVGAATFLLFAVILEKPLQSALLFPTRIGLPEHALSRFIGARSVLLALLASALVTVLVMKSKMKSAKLQTMAENYQTQALQLRDRQDRFLLEEAQRHISPQHKRRRRVGIL